MSGSTITVSGTPTPAGTYANATLSVTDAAGTTSTETYTITVNAAPTLGALSSTDWTVNQTGFSGTIGIAGGTGPFSNLTATNLPAGLTASLSGSTITVSGTPTTVGTYANATLSVTDAAGATSTGTFTITINAAPALGTLTPTQWTVGRAGYSGAIPLSGGTGALTVSAQSNLPPGLSAAVVGSNIVFTGTPTAAGTYGNVELTVRDTSGATSTGTFSITVNPAPALGALSSTAWTANQAGFSGTIDIAAGTGPFSNLTANGLPPGLTVSLSGSIITLSGTPTAAGTFNNINVSVADTAGATSTGTYSINVNAAPTLGALSSTTWTMNQPGFSGTVAVGAGTGPYGGLTASNLPPGLTASLSGSTITVNGTPTTAGTYANATLSVTDAVGAVVSGTFTFTVSAAPALGGLAPTQWTVGRPGYSGSIPLSGGTGALTVSFQSNLPPGLSATVVGSNVVFTGTPNTAGTYGNVELTVRDTAGATSTGTFSITVNPAPALGALSSTAWTVNQAGFSGTIGIAAGTGPFSNLTATGLPPGLTASLSGNTITVSGTPTTAGTFNTITVSVTDAAGATSTGIYTITVNAMPTLGALSSTAWTMNQAGFSGTITVSGGTAPYSGLTASNLPPGLTASLSGSTITVSGTPTAAGTFANATLSVTDAAGAVISQSYTVVISAVSLGALSFNQWTINKTGFIGTIAAHTGTVASTLSVTSGKLPTGMTDSLSGGVITFAGKPTVAGTYTFTLNLNSLGVTATQSYTIVINPATIFVWTGLGADDNWTTPANWGGGAAPLAGDTLLFGAGATRKTANNNFPSGTTFAAVAFQDGGYTLTGNNLKLSAGISSTSTAGGTDTVGPNIALTATETFNIAGTTLIDITGIISGTHLGITKTGTGTLAYDSPAGNSYTGLTTVNGGTLQLETSNQIADTASVTVNAGATFDLNSHDETIANLTLTGGTVNTGSGTLTLSGNVTSDAATSSAVINGKLNLIGAVPTLSVNQGTAVNDLVIAASISAGSLTKLGLGTLVLSGNNSSYAGITKVSGGVLDVPNPTALGSGPVLALTRTTLQLDGNGLSFGNKLTLGSTGGATLNNVAGSNTWSGPITDAVTSTINVLAGTLTVTGGISGAGGLTKSGTGTLLLPDANRYQGITSVSAGVLDVQTPAALGNNTAMTVAAAGTLQIDGTGLNFSKTLSLRGTLASQSGSNTWSGKISTLAATSTVNVGTGNSLTLSGIISGAGGLTQVGGGSLLVSALNTYTGATTVNGGTLGGGGKIGTVVVNSGATIAPDPTTTQILKTGNVAFSAGSTLSVTLNGTTAGSGYDQLNVTGTVNLAGAALNVNLGFTPAVGSAFMLIQNDGKDAVVGTFAGLPQGATLVLDGMTFQISYTGGTGNDVVLTRTA